MSDIDETETGHATATEAPPPGEHHGFLEQFESLKRLMLMKVSLKLMALAMHDAKQSEERLMLMKVSLKLMALAMHDAKEDDLTPEMKSEIEALVLELETTLHLAS